MERRLGMRVILAAAVLAALAMVPFVWQRGTINRLRAENSSLSNRVAGLSNDLVQATQSKTPQATNPPGNLPREQLHELMRLRAEVGDLRHRTNSSPNQGQTQPHSNATGMRPLTSEAATAPAAAEQGTNNVITGPWRNAGFAQPADAAQTLIWSAHAGNMETLMSAMTPEAQAAVQQDIASGALTADALKNQFSLIHSLHPSANHQTTEYEAFFNAQSANLPKARNQPGDPHAGDIPGTTQQLLRFQKIGNQWLYAGRVNP
jgi:hypothetical protein